MSSSTKAPSTTSLKRRSYPAELFYQVTSNQFRDHEKKQCIHVWFKDDHYLVCNKTNANILNNELSPNGELTDTWIGAVLRIVGRDQELDGHTMGKIEKVVQVITKPPSKPSREEARAAHKVALEGNPHRTPDMQAFLDAQNNRRT